MIDLRSEKAKKIIFTTERTAMVLLKVIAALLLVIMFTGIICFGAFGLYVRSELAPKADIDIGTINMNYTSTICYLDASGSYTELTSLHGSENRVWVNYDEIPKYLINAIIAIEDERFESHKGVDWKRTFGAALNLVLPFSGNFGGSTITQQLVKNLTQEDEVTVQRKVLEILRALNIERKLSKEQIIEMYLNTINLSQGCYGVRAAANVYFGKEVSELDLAECACLAGITNSPTYYDPFQNRRNNKERQELILKKLLDLGKISREEYSSAVSETLQFNMDQDDASEDTSADSYFVDYLIGEIISDLMDQYGYSRAIAYKMLYSGGLTIEATIDPAVQDAIEKVYADRSNFPTMKGTTQPESAMVIMSPDGRLLGLVGGIGEKYGSLVLNRAVSKRSPGSAIKPISVYAPALEYGLITPYTVLDDTPSKLITKAGALIEAESAALTGMDVSVWPANSNRTYRGLTTVSKAVAYSLNTIAVRVLDMLSLDTSFDFATNNFGLSLNRDTVINNQRYTDIGYSQLALGGLSQGVSLLEMTAAYVPFVNEGVYVEPTAYTRVLDSDGNVILSNVGDYHVAISTETAYYMRTMLEETVKSGTATAAQVPNIATAGKTGTTSNDYDRWFVGFTPYYVGGVWFGFDSNREMGSLSFNPSVEIWNKVMTALHAGKPSTAFEEPSGLVTSAYCLDSGNLPTSICERDERGSRVAYGKFFPGDAPTSSCRLHTTATVCTASGRLAGAYCPADTKQTAVRLDLYRYFFTPAVVVGDERYTVHRPGTLSDAILAMYYPAISKEGASIEGTCNVHTGAR